MNSYQGESKAAQKTVKIELELEKLEVLIKNRHLCAAQIRCLDNESKQLIRALCLDLCAYKPASSKGKPIKVGN